MVVNDNSQSHIIVHTSRMHRNLTHNNDITCSQFDDMQRVFAVFYYIIQLWTATNGTLMGHKGSCCTVCEVRDTHFLTAWLDFLGGI